MARELAPHGVRVNVVQPGHMYTANEQAGMAGWTQAARDAYLPRIPVGRMGTGEDIGHAVVFLCSSSASYITGATLSVDGGYTTALDLQADGGPAELRRSSAAQ